MRRIDEAVRERDELLAKQRSLIDGAAKRHKESGEDGEPRWTEAEQTEYQNRETDLDSLDAEIERLNRQEERERSLDTAAAEREEEATRHEHDTGGDTSKRELNSDEYRTAWWTAAITGPTNCTPEQRELLDNHVPRNREEGPIPKSIQFAARTMSSSDLGTGGALVPPASLGQLYEALKDFGSVEKAGANVMTTQTGVSFEYPTVNETNKYGERIGEAKAATTADPSMGSVSVGAFIYSSTEVDVPIPLIQDSPLNVESMVIRWIGERIGRKQNQDWTVATGGGNAPEGVVTAIPAASITTASTGNATTIKKADDLIDLQHSVDPAYLSDPSCGWMMHHQELREVRKLKDGEGRWLFQPATAGMPASILGFPLTMNNEMSSPTASTIGMLFGAFRYYLIRRVAEMYLFNLRETGAKNFRVDFVGFHRADGKLINAGTAPIVAWKHSAT